MSKEKMKNYSFAANFPGKGRKEKSDKRKLAPTARMADLLGIPYNQWVPHFWPDSFIFAYKREERMQQRFSESGNHMES